MKTKPEEKKHAKFSASASHRWLACPGSIALSQTVPVPPDTAAAQEGTQGHECLETLLKNGPHKQLATESFLSKKYPLEMVLHAAAAAKIVWALAQECKGEVLSESKSELFHIDPEMHGTNDVAILDHFGTLFVLDYKYGRMPVDPEGNTQLIFYALGIAHRYQYNFETVVMAIIQPRAKHAGGPFRASALTMEELRQWNARFLEGVKAAKKKNAPLNAGGHCFFCPAKSVCPEFTPEVLAEMRASFIQPKTPEQIQAQIAIDFDDTFCANEATNKVSKKKPRKSAW